MTERGPGGPILVAGAPANPFGYYLAEVLRTEGLNAFTVADISSVTWSTLTAHDLVVLGEMPLTSAQVAMFEEWVACGGGLIAMRPDRALAGLLGLVPASSTLPDGYIRVETSSPPGAGITAEALQFHGVADMYRVADAATVARLCPDPDTATPNPAVTLRGPGPGGGRAAAFAFDLARSVVYTRQGNQSWAGQARGGTRPIRPHDLFFGAAGFDPRPDWVDLSRVAIPQADEQQRLLVNLIEHMNLDRKPLPRFWYFPRGLRSVVVMTGDDHLRGGTAARFEAYKAAGPVGCSVPDWECVRATAYVFRRTSLTDAEAAAFTAEGFEVALHVSTRCEDFTGSSLEDIYARQLQRWREKYASLPSPSTNRTHCVVWSDWATQPEVQLRHGIRLDTTYYYYPASWVADRPGFFTGSGIPMRFAALDGWVIDVYQAATQMTDESGQTYPSTVDALLDGALGPKGYYGAFTANMHMDRPASAASDAIVAAARERGVPVVSARQMLDWLDGRDASSFGSLSWSGNTLRFTISVAPGACGLQAMVPTASAAGRLTAVRRSGTPVAHATEKIKGLEYALFPAVGGNYEASYRSYSGSEPPRKERNE